MGMPYRVIGGPRFYERQEIKDAIAYLEVMQNPADDLKFERIVNVPKRGLGDQTCRPCSNSPAPKAYVCSRPRGISSRPRS